MDLVDQAEAREAEARACFVRHDLDGSDTIDAAELAGVLSSLGLKNDVSSEEEFNALVDATLRHHDKNADGVLSVEEFISVYNAVAKGGHLSCMFCGTELVRSKDILSENHNIYGKRAFYVRKGVQGAIGGSYVYPMQLQQGRLKCCKAMCVVCTASLGISFIAAAEGETNDVSEWFGKHCLSSACVKKFPPGPRKGTWDLFCTGCNAPVTSHEFVLSPDHCLNDVDDAAAGLTPANYVSGIRSGASVESSISVERYSQGPMGSCAVRCAGCKAYLGIRFKSDEGTEGANAMQVGNYVLLKSKVREGPAVERLFSEFNGFDEEENKRGESAADAASGSGTGGAGGGANGSSGAGLKSLLGEIGVSDDATIARGSAW